MYLHKRRRDDKRNEVGAGEDTAEEAAVIEQEFGREDAHEEELDQIEDED